MKKQTDEGPAPRWNDTSNATKETSIIQHSTNGFCRDIEIQSAFDCLRRAELGFLQRMRYNFITLVFIQLLRTSLAIVILDISILLERFTPLAH